MCRLLFYKLNPKHFSYVFIDEAGQATEPDSLIPLNLVSSLDKNNEGIIYAQVVLSGDPHQSGPFVRSKISGSILGKIILYKF